MRRTPKQCNGYPWAIGPVCHVITHMKWLKEPVDIPQKGQGAFIKLYADNPEHRRIAEKVHEQVTDREWIELDTSPLDAPALPHGSASTSAGSSSSAGSGSASATDGTTAPPDDENQSSEPVAGNIVEVELPGGSKVQGSVVYRTDDLYCVQVDHEWHKGVKRSDLRVMR